MYNNQIKTFIKVADIGSFNKASQELFIATSSIIKQINSLENRLDVNLFERTPQGLKLTHPGQIIYRASKDIITMTNDAVKQAQNVKDKENLIIRLGVSPVTPGKLLIDSWEKVKEYNPHTKLEIIPYQNSMENAHHILQNLGVEIDLVIGILDSLMLSYYQCNGIELYNTPVRINVPSNHRLVEKSVISIDDLKNESIYIMKNDLSSSFSNVREYLQQFNDIHLIDIDGLETRNFNDAENKGNLILSIKELKDIHPLMQQIDVNWAFEVPIGIFYPEFPSSNICNIIEILQNEVFELNK
ncbi:TPA: LysR family transcriptional regulator [Staphylococcus aureus]